jgi:hypothetical protein
MITGSGPGWWLWVGGLFLVLVGYILRNEEALRWEAYRLELVPDGPSHILGMFKHICFETGGVMAVTGLVINFW